MEGPILHVIVVGFHHKKGCQVEFSYPPLIEGNSVESNEIPEEWKHIPSLALPDGAHNFVKDTVYFILPGRKDNLHTVYGVSCYRQMDAKDLINRTADVTRSTVQKSVCVLSRLPLFGLIKAKLELITHAYFDEKDFSQVSLLEQTFKNLNSSLTESLLEGTQVFLGLPARELVAVYKHKIIILFKLLMLERRVLFFGSPVESLCQTVLGVLSLFPSMLENGLMQACNQWNEKLSPTLCVASFNSELDEDEQFLEVRYHNSISESPVLEILEHTNNTYPNIGASGDVDYTILDINYEDATKYTISANEPPESPSIPRDSFDKINKQRLNQDLKENKDKLDSKSPLVDDGNVPHKDMSHSQRLRSTSSSDSDKLAVHALLKTTKSNLENNASIHYTGDTNHSCDSSQPELSSKIITQSGDIQNFLNAKLQGQDAKGKSDKVSETEKQGVLTLYTTICRPETDEIIEDLDSPESISKIDREDCFSWEQDHLQLSIDHDQDLYGSGMTDSVRSTSSASASHDSVTVSDKESISSDSTASSQTQQEKHGKNSTSVGNIKSESELGSPLLNQKKSKAIKNKLSAAFSKVGNKSKLKEKEEAVPHLKGEVLLHQDQFGYPLAIFTKGSVCHPYLSLQYHDILTDVNTRSFVIGATNILFKQKHHLLDAVIEVGEGKLDIRDRELQRILNLTTADLRFADYLIKTVMEEKTGFLDGTEWEGSDEWVRAQFKHYINSLLSTVIADDSKALDDFGSAFISTWKTTHNFRYWQEKNHPAMVENLSGHPFQGNLSMADVRVRFNHTLQSTERGRKINAAVVQTGKYVVQTGKAVGGAISSAKSAVSGWFSSWRHNEKTPEGPQQIPEDSNSGQATAN